jgi:hypothetical protein
MITEYRVIEADDTEALMKQVGDAILAGFKPLGGVSATHVTTAIRVKGDRTEYVEQFRLFQALIRQK